jgi:hypothetical protein
MIGTASPSGTQQFGVVLVQGVRPREHGTDLAGLVAGLVLSGSTLMVPEYLSVLGGDPNGPFEPAATPCDWLSRDAAVRKYLDDP